jgi:hypothetical protein
MESLPAAAVQQHVAAAAIASLRMAGRGWPGSCLFSALTTNDQDVSRRPATGQKAQQPTGTPAIRCRRRLQRASTVQHAKSLQGNWQLANIFPARPGVTCAMIANCLALATNCPCIASAAAVTADTADKP